jgi:hypothetical protein
MGAIRAEIAELESMNEKLIRDNNVTVVEEIKEGEDLMDILVKDSVL